jgi:hypothetical protein
MCGAFLLSMESKTKQNKKTFKNLLEEESVSI